MKTKKTMKIKTASDALNHCFDLWLWLAWHPYSSKCNWPGLISNGGYLEALWQYCPLCELYFQNCVRCKKLINVDLCTSQMSPYNQWTRATLASSRSKAALEIAIIALEALGKIKERDRERKGETI